VTYTYIYLLYGDKVGGYTARVCEHNKYMIWDSLAPLVTSYSHLQYLYPILFPCIFTSGSMLFMNYIPLQSPIFFHFLKNVIIYALWVGTLFSDQILAVFLLVATHLANSNIDKSTKTKSR